MNEPEIMCTTVTTPNCLMQAWHGHERELRAWLIRQLGDRVSAEDILQDVFLKAMRQGERFCSIDNARAWLFEVSRNTLLDHFRHARETVEISDELVAEDDAPPPVDSLAACLPRVLTELNPEDRDAITCCDLNGMTQEDYALKKGLTLPGAKSRVQRARKRLKQLLARNCLVRFDDAGRVCCFVPRTPIPVSDESTPDE